MEGFGIVRCDCFVPCKNQLMCTGKSHSIREVFLESENGPVKAERGMCLPVHSHLLGKEVESSTLILWFSFFERDYIATMSSAMMSPERLLIWPRHLIGQTNLSSEFNKKFRTGRVAGISAQKHSVSNFAFDVALTISICDFRPEYDFNKLIYRTAEWCENNLFRSSSGLPFLESTPPLHSLRLISGSIFL